MDLVITAIAAIAATATALLRGLPVHLQLPQCEISLTVRWPHRP